jgi:hypothetical protein
MSASLFPMPATWLDHNHMPLFQRGQGVCRGMSIIDWNRNTCLTIKQPQ